MAVATAPVAFWLLPAEPDAAKLKTLIRELARDNGTVAFEPHVTLHVGKCRSNADLGAVLRKVALASAPLGLIAHATRESDECFKALYVELDAEAAIGDDVDEVNDDHRAGRADSGRSADVLPALRRQLVAEVLQTRAGPRDDAAAPLPAPPDLEQALGGYSFLPHLSLLYGKLPPPLRRRLAACNDMRGRRLRFDRIAAVRPAADHADLSKVAHWDVFGHQRLGG